MVGVCGLIQMQMPRFRQTHRILTGSGPKNRTQIWSECEDSVRAWCERMGAELYNLPKRPFQPQWVIFDGFEHSLETGRQSAWIDCDIFVARDAPNIFELPDRFYFCQPDPTRRIHPRMRRQWRNYGAVNPRPYLVSALAMWSDTSLVPTCSAWARICSMSHGPWITSAKPG